MREFMATSDFKIRMKIENSLRKSEFYTVPMTMAGVGTAVLAKLAAEKSTLFQSSNDFIKSDGGGFTGKRVAAGVGAAGVGAAAGMLESYLKKHPPTLKTVAGATVAGAVAGNAAYDWLNPESADVAEGHIYDFRQVLKVSYERDLSFRTTLRSFRDQFGGRLPERKGERPALEVDGIQKTLQRVNTILGHTKTFFLQIPKDTRCLNVVNVLSFLEMYRLDDRINDKLKADNQTLTLGQLVKNKTYIVDGDGYSGLYRKAPTIGMVLHSNTTPVYTDRTQDGVPLEQIVETTKDPETAGVDFTDATPAAPQPYSWPF
jgi:hypothetical protein